MANVSSLISLDAFVRRLLLKEGKDNGHYIRYMQIATDGLKDLYIHHFDVEVTSVVTVDTNTNTFAYPNDYVRYTMIGTPIDGRWWYFTRDLGMVPLSDDDGAEIMSSAVNLAEYHEVSSLSSGGGYNRYYFREDHANRRFQIAGFTPDIVVLKYVSNGIDSAGTINIPDYALPVLEAYVRLNMADYDDIAESTVQRLDRQYKDKLKQMRMAQRPPLQDLIDVLYSTSSQLLSR